MEFLQKHQKLVRMIALLGMLFTAGIAILYFWFHSDFESVHKLPSYVLFVVLLYLGFNFLRKQLNPKSAWWDWIYYVGIVSILFPITLGKPEQLELINLVTDFGTLFLLIPIFMDAKKVLKDKKI